MRSYNSAQRRYLQFCDSYKLSPLPLSESSLCLFAAYLAYQGLKPQTINSYLAALRHLQVSAGLPTPNRADWPRLHYTLRGIQRSQPSAQRQRLPITATVMRNLLHTWSSAPTDHYKSRLMWAASCLAFFGFLRSGEFTLRSLAESPAILASDAAVDSRTEPSVVTIRLRRAKTDPFGRGVSIYLGKTETDICPVAAILNYLAVRPQGEGPLFVHRDGSPLLKQQFITGVRQALSAAGLDPSLYSGHSFRIGAATTAAAAGIPDHLIKTLGRWESSAYLLYVRTPRESLAAVSARLALHSQATPPPSTPSR